MAAVKHLIAKTGVARLALATGAPVVPLGHWGAQVVLPYGSFKPRVIPRRTVRLLAGPPVELGGRYYLDAGLSESIPYQTAMAHGATHVLVLSSRQEGDVVRSSWSRASEFP